MKKKLFIIIPIVVAILVFVGVFAYFNKEDQETSLTVTEKRWLEKNSATKVDFEVINDYPIFGMNGNGVVFQFLSDFEETTELEFNKLSYLKGEQPKTTSYRVRVLNNEDTLTAKDLLIAEDNYIAVGTSQLKLNNIKDFKDMTIGVLTSDVGELSYYLKTGSNLTYKTYEDIESLIAALKSGDVSQAIFPKLMYLNQYIADKELYINYNFTEISKKIVLTLSDEDTRLNEIITKYFENWKNKYYVTNYNKAYFNYYAEMNKINDKTKADLVSKTYVYGYVENAPYEVTMDKQVVGIAGEYVARMERLTGIEFTYKKYKNQEELKNAIANGEVDIYFDYDNTTNEKYQSTISTFIEQYVVLGKVSMNEVVNSFESLKGKRINMLKNDALYAYFKDNGSHPQHPGSRGTLGAEDWVGSGDAGGGRDHPPGAGLRRPAEGRARHQRRQRPALVGVGAQMVLRQANRQPQHPRNRLHSLLGHCVQPGQRVHPGGIGGPGQRIPLGGAGRHAGSGPWPRPHVPFVRPRDTLGVRG